MLSRFPTRSALAALTLAACAACEPHEDPLAQPTLMGSEEALGNTQVGFQPVLVPLPTAEAKPPRSPHVAPVQDWTIRRTRELEALVRAKPELVEEVFVPIRTLRDESVANTLRSTGLAVSFLHDIARGLRAPIRFPACLARVAPPGGAPRWSLDEGAMGVDIRQCRFGPRQDMKIAGLAVVTWGGGVMVAEMTDVQVASGDDAVEVSARLEWPSWNTDPSPLISVNVRSLNIAGPRREISIDDAQVELPDLDGNYGLRVIVSDGQAHVRWAEQPSRAIDFGADMHFNFAPDSPAFERFEVAASYHGAIDASTSAEVSRLEMRFDETGFTGAIRFAVDAGASRLRTEGDGLALLARGRELYTSGRLSLFVDRLGATAEMVARDMRFDLGEVALPSEGGMDLRWDDHATENTLILQFQANSPSSRWVRAFHREFYELVDSSSGAREPMSHWGWFCAQLESKPVVERLDDDTAHTVYCE